MGGAGGYVIMSGESPVSMHKVTYRGAEEFLLKWLEGGKECEAKFATEADAVMATGEIEERLRVAALAGQGLTVNPFGAHTPFINSKDVHYASMKLQPRGLKFREVIDDYVGAATVLKGLGAGVGVGAAAVQHAQACKALQAFEVTPEQALFEWMEVKRQIGDQPFHVVLKAYLQTNREGDEGAHG